MRRITHLGVACLAALVLLAPGIGAVEPAQLAGTWVGEWNDFEMEWRFKDDGRVRVDGRPGTFQLDADKMIVRFDPLDSSRPDQFETAIYRFIASHPSQVPARLFIYGFDLGNGISLERIESPESEETPSSDPILEEGRHASRSKGAGAGSGVAAPKKE